MSLSQMYSYKFSQLRLLHHVSSLQNSSKSLFDNPTLLTESREFINKIIIPALERKINEYLNFEANQKFINTFDYVICLSSTGKVFLLYDSDVKYFNESLQIFKFTPVKDISVVYQYIKHFAAEEYLSVEDYNYEGAEYLNIGIQF